MTSPPHLRSWCRNRQAIWLALASTATALLSVWVGGRVIQLPPIVNIGLEAPIAMWLSLGPVIAYGGALARRPSGAEDASDRRLVVDAMDLVALAAMLLPFLALLPQPAGAMALRNVAAGGLLTLVSSRLHLAAPPSALWTMWVLTATLAGQTVRGPYWWSYPALAVTSPLSAAWSVMVAGTVLLAATLRVLHFLRTHK